MRQRPFSRQSSQLFFGVMLLIIGLLFLIDNLFFLDIGPVWRYWPLIIIAVGLHKLLNAQNQEAMGSGVWWIFIGAWLLVSIAHFWGLGFRDTWPIPVIGIGIGMLWKALARNSNSSYARGQ